MVLRFPGTPPSFLFHISANLGGQSCLMDFSPISAAQLWWRLGPADRPEVGIELGATNWAAEAPIHTNPISSPLCRLLRLCFLESNLHFGNPLKHLTIYHFFGWKTKPTPIRVSLPQMMMGSWTAQVLAAELCTVCPISQLCLLNMQLDSHTCVYLQNQSC